MPELEADARLLEQAVREAGGLALKLFRQTVRKWNKADGSPVTEADVSVDKLLREALHGSRPGYGWLSEETPDDGDRLVRQRLWIADPIDGTRSFAGGGDRWCVGVALIEAGRPMLAAVYRPVTEEFYWAVRGAGAWLNGARISVSDAHRLCGARIGGSRKALQRFRDHDVVPDNTHDSPLLLRLCRVASGEIDGAFSPGHKNDWDLAPGDLMVHEAGGQVTGLDGASYVFNRPAAYQAGLVAANEVVHRQMIVAGKA